MGRFDEEKKVCLNSDGEVGFNPSDKLEPCADLSGKTIENQDLSGVDLRGANLDQTTLKCESKQCKIVGGGFNSFEFDKGSAERSFHG